MISISDLAMATGVIIACHTFIILSIFYFGGYRR